jgi:hypothetical protein
VALFPDCVSERGSRHLRELIRLKAQGCGRCRCSACSAATCARCARRRHRLRIRPPAARGDRRRRRGARLSRDRSPGRDPARGADTGRCP